tara:strand:- start:78 stop:563 length:486 start_codon:yes stop_codon:yes gene_type:complete
MRFFVLSLFLFIILLVIISAKQEKRNSARIEHFFEDSETALEEMDGVMRDPTMTFSTNTMKGPDDKPLNEGKTVKGYKSATGYVFKPDEVSKTFPLAVKGQLVDNEAMAVICWRAASKMFEQVSAQEKIINDLTGKLSLVEQRLNAIEPALENVKEADTTP